MKVLLVSASYAPVLGGLQTVTHQLACELMRIGHHVQVVTNLYPRSLPTREVLDGVPVERWPFLNSGIDALRDRRLDLALAGAYYNRATLARLTRLVAQFEPDVVNLHSPDARFASVLRVRRQHPLPLVVSLHGDDVERWFKSDSAGRRPSNLERFLHFLRAADTITACSQYLLDRATLLEPSVAAKGRVIHNGLDLARFRDRAAHAHPRPYILAYGRFTRKKGFDLLLQSFAGVAGRYPDVDLILAGDGEERAALQRITTGLKLAHRVAFFGRATADQVVRLLNGCRLAVIPSREEPFGIAALETILAGRPMVATRVGGLPELVAAAGDGAVRWAEPEVGDLTRVLSDALSHPCAACAPRRTEAHSVLAMTRAYLAALHPENDSTAAAQRRLRAS